MELQRGPGTHVFNTGSELPLHRAVGVFGTDVGELGVDMSRWSDDIVEPRK